MIFSKSGREKPDNWEPSGRRIQRGLYRSAAGYLINADCNGAANTADSTFVRYSFISPPAPHLTKSAASYGFPHRTKSEASSGFPLSKGDGRGILKGGSHKCTSSL